MATNCRPHRHRILHLQLAVRMLDVKDEGGREAGRQGGREAGREGGREGGQGFSTFFAKFLRELETSLTPLKSVDGFSYTGLCCTAAKKLNEWLIAIRIGVSVK